MALTRGERERDAPPLAATPEGSEAKPPPSSSDWNDEDAEDREEQGLFERDNAVVPAEDEEAGGVDDADGKASSAADDGDGEGDGDGEADGGEPSAAEEEGDRVGNGPFYVQSPGGDSWELTWPIWHMLPREERRAIALQHGMKTIGEFEEYMTLTRAVDESGGGGLAVRRPDSAMPMPEGGSGSGEARRLVDSGESASESQDQSQQQWQPPFVHAGDDDSSVSSSEDVDPTDGSVGSEPAVMDMESHLEMIRLGGLPCSIPDEILHKCFAFLPIDDHATLALVSPHWSRFTRCESLYKILCERVYLNQSKRKALHISRFGNSYRTMLELRPRVRTGGGLYVLRYQEVRKIQRDMWTEIPVGAVLETIYYRYIYFFEDGRVMYALTHATPGEMIPRFGSMLLNGHGSKDKWGVWGRYQIKRDVVRVWVSQSWHDVCFQLSVVPSNKAFHYDTADRGMYTTMTLEKHMSSASGNFGDDSYDLVKYDIPSHCRFRFLRDRRL
ncbi:hypothetical protein ACHAWF_018476 [Thalassiosira exigua]